LGFSRQLDFGEAIGCGRDGEPTFWIADGTGLGPDRETHIAFQAADENAVRAFHEAPWERVPNRCMSRGFGRNITPATSGLSCAIRTAMTSKRSITGPDGGDPLRPAPPRSQSPRCRPVMSPVCQMPTPPPESCSATHSPG
jgi:hypothetical protein